MIGVKVQDHQKDAAREFFELFKTPWEFYHGGKPYDVILTTIPFRKHPKAKLLIISTPGFISPEENGQTHSDTTLAFHAGKTWPLYKSSTLITGVTGTIVSTYKNGQTLGYRTVDSHGQQIHLGYDIFEETQFLLNSGQPAQYAHIPTLDRHIALIRTLILDAGIGLIEIPPVPEGYNFTGCLTHDVDFVRLQDHGFDHTVKGYLLRATAGSVKRWITGRQTFKNMLKNWGSVLTWPLVCMGLKKDPWLAFNDYAQVEYPSLSTFFMIPFKGKAGQGVTLPYPERRATRYGIEDVAAEVKDMSRQGFEIGLHNIDAWIDPDAAQDEKHITESTSNAVCHGTRSHWLCFNEQTPKVLEEAEFSYDATCGYNDAIGYKAGTSQVFKPLQCNQLLEMPLHIQDVAMFYPVYMNLTPDQAVGQCDNIIEHATHSGGVVTLLWHMRSLAPERLWQDTYKILINSLREHKAWIAPAYLIAQWFTKRRSISFGKVNSTDASMEVNLNGTTDNSTPPIVVRRYYPDHAQVPYIDLPWNGYEPVRFPSHPEAPEQPPPSVKEQSQRICVLRHGYFPQDPRVYKEVRALKQAGYHVDVICLRNNGDKPYEEIDDIHIHRLAHSHQRGSKLRYLFEYGLSMLHMTTLVTRLHIKNRYACIQVNTMPDALVFATLIPRLMGARILLDMHEPMPELYETKYGKNASTLIIKIQKYIEKLSIGFAHHALTVNDTIRQRFIDRGAPPRKISVVRNVPSDDFAATKTNRENTDCFDIITHGTLQPRYGHDVIIHALPIICDIIPHAHLTIIGAGETEPLLQDLVKKLHCEKVVTFVGNIPFKDIADRIAQADIGLVPLMPCPFSELCQPNKLLEYIAVQTPVVAARFPALLESFDDTCISYFTPGDPAALATAVISLYNHPTHRREQAQRAYKQFENIRWQHASKVYTSIVDSLIDQDSA